MELHWRLRQVLHLSGVAKGDKSLIQEEDTSSAAGGTEVKIGKSKYIVTDDFSDTIIPDGFVERCVEI